MVKNSKIIHFEYDMLELFATIVSIIKNDEDSFTFSASEKHELQRLLHGIGLDKHFLMGDLDGLCNTLNWSFANGIAFA